MSKIVAFILIICVVTSCREQFDAPASPETGYLVVEGVINSGQGPTTIRLSRTIPLADTNALRPERFAQVRVEGDNNSSAMLFEVNDGVYTADQLSLDDHVKYRLHIYLNGGKEYMTEYVSVRKTPPIDGISWERRGDGVELFIDTHDPQDTTRYYRWEYEETWEFNSHYITTLHYVSDPSGYVTGVDYNTADQTHKLYTCWASEKSSNILIGTSIKLARDTIHLPLLFVPQHSWKMSVLYSINVKQYSPSAGGYEFLQRMKKNTENLGSLFDAQPSQLVGNIHCVQDPDEPVIGFVDVAQVQQKRAFIKRSEVAPWNFRMDCYELTVPNHPDSINPLKNYLLPTTVAQTNVFGNIVSFFVSSTICVDCTTRGTNVKPSFWP